MSGVSSNELIGYLSKKANVILSNKFFSFFSLAVKHFPHRHVVLIVAVRQVEFKIALIERIYNVTVKRFYTLTVSLKIPEVKAISKKCMKLDLTICLLVEFLRFLERTSTGTYLTSWTFVSDSNSAKKFFPVILLDVILPSRKSYFITSTVRFAVYHAISISRRAMCHYHASRSSYYLLGRNSGPLALAPLKYLICCL